MDISGQGWRVLSGSCLDRLPELEDASVDAVVCDPPYELGFMGKRWDSSGIAFDVRVWAECFRVLKPGGHLLAFGGTRTWHRIAVAIEDAGFDIRDSIAWLYGSGFPKSLDVSKAIDKAAGAEREVVGEGTSGKTAIWQDGGMGNFDITAPATPDAQKWQGWGTALKPAFEPVIVARKPLIGTVAENVLQYGTGGLNIDGARIGLAQGEDAEKMALRSGGSPGFAKNGYVGGSGGGGLPSGWDNSKGRWPANVMLDEYTAALLDEQSGVSVSKQSPINREKSNSPFLANQWVRGVSHSDTGGASRFFYVAKASRRDRNEGLDELAPTHFGSFDGKGRSRKIGANPDKPNAPRANTHPTVKPTGLMRQLVRLVTPPGGVVLDPFTGSGSTGKAAILEGFEFIGCELTDDYLPIIEGRLNHAVGMVEELAAEAKAREAETLF